MESLESTVEGAFGPDGGSSITMRKASTVRGIARHSLGMLLLLCVVFLWTASNFLASTILADDSYSKPFFITYINTSLFLLFLLNVIARRVFRLWRRGKLSEVTSWRSFLEYLDSHGMKENFKYVRELDEEEADEEDDERSTPERQLLHGHHREVSEAPSALIPPGGRLGLKKTARLSVQFCMLWFLANYFALACLQYATVGSTTILTSTSGVWTLIFGVVIGVEKFTVRKFLGVVASLVGVILISRVDMSSHDESVIPPPDAGAGNGGDGGQGSFPNKTAAETALGDAMAAFSAIVYGVYTIVMKKQVGDESRVNMQLFFGLVGLFNVFFLWPGFVILHLTGIEQFALPPTKRIWTIILVNSICSLISDICWAYAMLLTTPLVVTVGLSLTIPLSLVGQIILQRQYASVLYWIGAAIVFLSFLIVNHESKGHDEKDQMVTVMVPERSEQDVSLDEERWIRSAIPSAPAVIQSRSRLD